MGRAVKVTNEIAEWIRARDAEGVPRVEIARRVGGVFGVEVSAQWVRHLCGTKRHPGGKVSAKVYATEAAIDRAKFIAGNLFLTAANGPDAGSGSLSALVQAIGDGTVEVRRVAA
jgi:hypothetical protein